MSSERSEQGTGGRLLTSQTVDELERALREVCEARNKDHILPGQLERGAYDTATGLSGLVSIQLMGLRIAEREVVALERIAGVMEKVHGKGEEAPLEVDLRG